MPDSDPIAETEQHFQQLSEQRLPSAGLSDPLQSAIQQSRATGSLNQQSPSNLIDQAIASRQAIEQRRSALIGQLPYANRRQANAIGAELHGLDQNQRSLDFQANQTRMQAHIDAVELDRKLKTDRETTIDQHGAGLMQSMGYLESALRNGNITKDEYDNGLLEAAQQFPMGLRHPEAARHYNFAITEADKYNQFAARRDYTEAAKWATKYGVPVQTDDNGRPSLDLTRQAAMQTPEGKLVALNQMNQELKAKYGLGTGVSSLFNPVQPHSSPDEGKTIDIPYADHTGKIGKVNVPAPLFNQMKADFNDRYFQVAPQQTAQPAQQPAATGLQAGATRDVAGKTYQWSGTRWEAQ